MSPSPGLPAALTLLLTLAPLAAQDLQPGASAPALRLEQWACGEALARFEPDVVYLVEFWGADPGMGFQRRRDFARLQKQHGAKLGIVGVIAGGEDYDFDGVANYYKEHGKGMTFRAGFDGDGAAHKAWVAAAGQEAPAVFVVDGAGKVAWIGGFGFLDIVLPRILQGGADPRALAEESAAVEKQFTRVLLIAGFKPQDAVAEMEKLLKSYPALAPIVVTSVYNTLVEGDEPQCAEPLQQRVCEICIANEDPDSLNMLAWTIVDPEVARENRDLATAERAAKKAVEFTREREPSVLDTLARVCFWQDDFKQAVAWQKKAIALLAAGEERDAYVATLREYEELLRGK